MPYIKREDGFNATQAAHRGNALGGLNEVTRDKSAPDEDPATIVFWTTSDDIQPGDQICGGDSTTPEDNAAAYDLIAGLLLKKSYELIVLRPPSRRIKLSEELAEVTLYLETPGLPRFVIAQGKKRSKMLENRLEQLNAKEVRDKGELTAIESDLRDGRSVRVARLQSPDRPGATIEHLEDCLVGESVFTLVSTL